MQAKKNKKHKSFFNKNGFVATQAKIELFPLDITFKKTFLGMCGILKYTQGSREAYIKKFNIRLEITFTCVRLIPQ